MMLVRELDDIGNWTVIDKMDRQVCAEDATLCCCASLLKGFVEAVEEWGCLCGRQGSAEVGTVAFLGIGQEGELGDKENGAVDLQ